MAIDNNLQDVVVNIELLQSLDATDLIPAHGDGFRNHRQRRSGRAYHRAQFLDARDRLLAPGATLIPLSSRTCWPFSQQWPGD
ncbi:MAG: hypothetical protein R2857_01790 [Vampirovibrionales bacterium]